jgi:non-homologous end joining protein Ku
VIWSDEEVSTGKTTHAVDILAFVEAQDVPAHYFETPYQLVPALGGERLYTLLRETLQHTRKIGIAYVVIQAHQHLAALVPQGQSLVLNTLRCGNEADALSTLRPEQEEPDPDIDDIRDMELALVSQGGGRKDEGFKADIVTPEFLTEDDDDIDSALTRMLRRRPHAPDGYLPRRQRIAGQPRGSRSRMRSRPLS